MPDNNATRHLVMQLVTVTHLLLKADEDSTLDWEPGERLTVYERRQRQIEQSCRELETRVGVMVTEAKRALDGVAS